jgi:hypothetical protein
MRGLSSLLLVLIASCGGGGGNGDTDGGIDAPPSASCLEADTYQNLANIESKIFKTSCVFSGCHNGGATDAGRMDLREGMAHASIVGVESEIELGRQLVVPGNPAASYFLLMLGEIDPAEADPPTNPPPAAIGLMPQNAGGMLLCSQKRQAIVRWIEAGALDD